MAINKDNVLDASWNNESLLQIRTALQELLNALGDSIDAAADGNPASINLSVEGTVLTATVTLADGETELSSSVDLAGAISAAQVAVEIVNNLYTDSSSKALSAAMGVQLDRMSGTVLKHLHWVPGAAHALLAVGNHARYFAPELGKIYHFYGYTPFGQGQPELGLDVYTPPAGIIFYDIETGSCYRFNGTDMVDILSSKANASEVVPNNRTVNNKPLSSDVTIGMSDIQGLEEAIGQIEAGTTVVINSDGANVVDSHSNPSILVAPSARQMMMAANNIDILFRKVNDLYDKLAGIAFTEDKPANWKENANWLTPAVPTHTITLGTMTNVSASLNGTVINGSTSAEEGEVTILLTPSGNNYMSGISIKDASNHDVDFTQTDVAGGTEITFILYGNVTINASASSGIQVNVSGNGITSYTTGVEPNTAAVLTIPLPVHHTWGTVTITYGTDNITSLCDISPANNVNKVITLPATLDDMSKVISIEANAVEDDYATLDLENVGENVVVNHNANEHLYVGDTITIQPAAGFKLGSGTSASIGVTALTLTGDDYAGYSYTLGTNDVSNGGSSIAISATAETIPTYSVTLPTLEEQEAANIRIMSSGDANATQLAGVQPNIVGTFNAVIKSVTGKTVQYCSNKTSGAVSNGAATYHVESFDFNKGNNDEQTQMSFNEANGELLIENISSNISLSNFKTTAWVHGVYFNSGAGKSATNYALSELKDIPSWASAFSAYYGGTWTNSISVSIRKTDNSFTYFSLSPNPRNDVSLNENEKGKVATSSQISGIGNSYVFVTGVVDGVSYKKYIIKGFNVVDDGNEPPAE